MYGRGPTELRYEVLLTLRDALDCARRLDELARRVDALSAYRAVVTAEAGWDWLAELDGQLDRALTVIRSAPAHLPGVVERELRAELVRLAGDRASARLLPLVARLWRLPSRLSTPDSADPGTGQGPRLPAEVDPLAE